MTEILDDDDPVLEAPRACKDCRKANVPLMENSEGELLCDPCVVSRHELLARDFKRITDDPEQEVFFNYHVRIGVRVKDLRHFTMTVARLRALEILTGMPMCDDCESWEHELITQETADGDEVQEEPDGF